MSSDHPQLYLAPPSSVHTTDPHPRQHTTFEIWTFHLTWSAILLRLPTTLSLNISSSLCSYPSLDWLHGLPLANTLYSLTSSCVLFIWQNSSSSMNPVFSLLPSVSEQLDAAGEKSKNEIHWFHLKFMVTNLKICLAILPVFSRSFPSFQGDYFVTQNTLSSSTYPPPILR